MMTEQPKVWVDCVTKEDLILRFTQLSQQPLSIATIDSYNELLSWLWYHQDTALYDDVADLLNTHTFLEIPQACLALMKEAWGM